MPRKNEPESRKWVVSLLDPNLSTKFLEFKKIDTEHEAKIQQEIVVMYEGEQPIYFEYFDKGENIDGEKELTEEEKRLPEEQQKKIKEQHRKEARLNKLTNDPIFRRQIECCVGLLQKMDTR